jgi:GT2 family glycosyltransferase
MLRCSICITTHNRRADLERTLAELARLQPAADELLIVADGCSDGTVEFVREEHPHARLIKHEHSCGSVPSRNEMASLATGDVFISLDDDSYPLDRDFIGRVRSLFTENPNLAVAAFPQRSDEFPETLAAESFGDAQFVGSYVNSGAAIRREAFLQLGGYPPFFVHAYEEPDFALRCVAAGWQVRMEPSLVIRHHFTSAQRNEIRTHQRHARNELWSVLMRCPAPQLAGVAFFRIVRQFSYAWKRGLQWVAREPRWWFAAMAGVPRCLASRQPLPWNRYLAWMQLVRQPLTSEAEWNARFAQPRP